MHMKHGKLWARILSAVCVLALILPMISTALAASYPYDTTSMDDVNLRSRASTNSTVLKKIKAGDLVSILGTTGDFYRVKFDGKTGYAMKDYIDGTTEDADKPFDPSLAQSAPAAIYEYPYDTVVLQNVKLRKTAEAEGTVIRMLLAGSMVEVLDRTSNGFAKVKAEGKTGYVVDTHINLADIPAPTPVPTATAICSICAEYARDAAVSASSLMRATKMLSTMLYIDCTTIEIMIGTDMDRISPGTGATPILFSCFI